MYRCKWTQKWTQTRVRLRGTQTTKERRQRQIVAKPRVGISLVVRNNYCCACLPRPRAGSRAMEGGKRPSAVPSAALVSVAKRPRPDTADFEQRHHVTLVPPAPFTTLPSDLLRHIFGLFALRPRIHVLSRVCRRWRLLVTQSIVRLPPMRWTDSFEAAISIFPHLTSLSITARPRIDFALPGHLRQLILRRIAHVSRTALAELTSLDSLELADCGADAADLEALLDGTRTTLTSLSLNPSFGTLVPLTSYLQRARFPRLVDLDIFAAIQNRNSTADMVSAHAGQLTRLSVQAIRLISDTVSFPYLTTFAVTFYDTPRMMQFMARHSRITSLRLCGGYTLPGIIPHSPMATALQSIELRSPDREIDLKKLADCPRLTSLLAPNQCISETALSPVLCAQLTALDLSNSHRALPPALLAHFPSLTLLSFRSERLTVATKSVPLPRLRTLTWREADFDPPLFQRLVLDVCASLTSLRLVGCWQFDASLEEFATKLQQRGVEELTIVTGIVLGEERVREACKALRWIWVRVVPPREGALLNS